MGGTSSTSSHFDYDGQGRCVRIIERTNGVVESHKTFLWCGTELCEERDPTGATVTKRFFGQGEQIAGSNYFFTRDHLGSVREMTDSTATLRARYDYDPYGRRTKLAGDLDADFAFTGHYYHGPSGLHLAAYRSYDAETGRWTSRDPIVEVAGSNLYAYARNGPTYESDPTGLATWEELNSLKVAAEIAERQLLAAQAELATAEQKLAELRAQATPQRPCPWISGPQYNLNEALRRGELIQRIRELRNQIPKLAGAAATAAAAYRAALVGASGAVSAAFGATSGGAVLTGSAGAGAAAVGWSAVGAAGAAGYGAGLLINRLTNPLTGESIGKGVQDTFTYLFFSKGW
jgi:RHS repeat-associated protein